MPRIFPERDGSRDRSEEDAELGAEIAELLTAVSRRLRHAANAELDPLGVTWGQVRALRTIAAGGDAMRMSELADRLGIARRSATSVVDDLVARGLVARRPDPADRRGVAVVLTRRGAALLRDLRARRRSAALGMTATLSTDELRQLRDLLRRLDDPPTRI
jgi:DNA-binding MarR family transcriptional regulator